MSADPMKDLQRQADEMDRQGRDSSELRSTFAPQTDGLPADDFEDFEETIAKIEASPEYRALKREEIWKPGEKLALIHELAVKGADKAGCDGWRAQEMCRQIARLSAAPGGEGEPVAWPEKWSGPCTVGNMIANLSTLPPEMPLHTAYHIVIPGEPSILRVKRPTLSRERVDGITIKTGDKSVPYSAIIWAHPQEPEPVAWRPDRAEETGWLVESDDKGPLYHTASSTTRDASGALRFSRQEDAEAFIKAHGPNHYSSTLAPPWRAVEHRWG